MRCSVSSRPSLLTTVIRSRWRVFQLPHQLDHLHVGLRLLEHERAEVVVREGSRPAEDHAVEVLVAGSACLPRRCRRSDGAAGPCRRSPGRSDRPRGGACRESQPLVPSTPPTSRNRVVNRLCGIESGPLVPAYATQPCRTARRIGADDCRGRAAEVKRLEQRCLEPLAVLAHSIASRVDSQGFLTPSTFHCSSAAIGLVQVWPFL